jgi:hypothetical protein
MMMKKKMRIASPKMEGKTTTMDPECISAGLEPVLEGTKSLPSPPEWIQIRDLVPLPLTV